MAGFVKQRQTMQHMTLILTSDIVRVFRVTTDVRYVTSPRKPGSSESSVTVTMASLLGGRGARGGGRTSALCVCVGKGNGPIDALHRHTRGDRGSLDLTKLTSNGVMPTRTTWSGRVGVTGV